MQAERKQQQPPRGNLASLHGGEEDEGRVRVQKFQEALLALMKEHNCTLEVQPYTSHRVVIVPLDKEE